MSTNLFHTSRGHGDLIETFATSTDRFYKVLFTLSLINIISVRYLNTQPKWAWQGKPALCV